jgi:hypothetical protein
MNLKSLTTKQQGRILEKELLHQEGVQMFARLLSIRAVGGVGCSLLEGDKRLMPSRHRQDRF